MPVKCVQEYVDDKKSVVKISIKFHLYIDIYYDYLLNNL
jgi:hypothetical protein